MTKKPSILTRVMPISKALDAWRVNDPLGEYEIDWMEVKKSDATKLRKCVDGAVREHDIQAFLEKRPISLVQHLGGGHGRYALANVRLGKELVADFILAERDSDGLEWHLVELENSHARMFTRAGNPTKELNHAIRQITDWRNWISRNQDYASRPRSKSGLGFEDITTNAKGLVLIGRRRDNDEENNERRRRIAHDYRIEIHSYDYLIDRCQFGAEASERLSEEFARSAQSGRHTRNRKKKM